MSRISRDLVFVNPSAVIVGVDTRKLYIPKLRLTVSRSDFKTVPQQRRDSQRRHS